MKKENKIEITDEAYELLKSIETATSEDAAIGIVLNEVAEGTAVHLFDKFIKECKLEQDPDAYAIFDDIEKISGQSLVTVSDLDILISDEESFEIQAEIVYGDSLTEKVSHAAGISEEEAVAAAKAVGEWITKRLKNNKPAVIPGLGTIKVDKDQRWIIERQIEESVIEELQKRIEALKRQGRMGDAGMEMQSEV